MNTETKHTSGPYRVEVRDNEIQIWAHREFDGYPERGGRQHRECVAVINGGADTSVNGMADAALLAAAPALLEALTAVDEAITANPEAMYRLLPDETRQMIDNAIAKAEGRS